LALAKSDLHEVFLAKDVGEAERVRQRIKEARANLNA